MRSLRAGILQQERNMAVSKDYLLDFSNGASRVEASSVITGITEMELDMTIDPEPEPYTTQYFLANNIDYSGGVRRYKHMFRLTGSLGNSGFYVFAHTPNFINFKLSRLSGTDKWDIIIDGNKIATTNDIGDINLNLIGNDNQYYGQIKSAKFSGSNGVLADYDFTTGSGNTLFDKSGNQNHGTIYGAQWIEI